MCPYMKWPPPEPSKASQQPDDLAEDPYVSLLRIHDDRRHRWILRLEHDARAIAEIALDRRFPLTRGFRRHHRHDDVVRVRGLLTSYEHEVTVADVRVDHAVAAYTQREDVLTAIRQRRRCERQLTLPILFRKQRHTGRDTTQHGHRSKSCCGPRLRERQR